MEYTKRIGGNITYYRKQLGYKKRAAFIRLTGFDYLGKIENGKNVELGTLIRIAHQLHVSLSTLFDESLTHIRTCPTVIRFVRNLRGDQTIPAEDCIKWFDSATYQNYTVHDVELIGKYHSGK